MFGAQFLDDEEKGDEYKEMVGALASIKPMLTKVKNSNEEYAETARQILNEYSALFV